ncbi:hypothetical protein MMC30_006123 [Trapelia coarctata]|nr:hypothetical protein [Trapelia coarctata]
MTRSHSPYYQDPPQGHRSNGLTMPAPQPRYRSRTRRWPPPPSVEDEVVSLSREHSPAMPEFKGGEAQARGAVDQQPLILEANPQLWKSASKSHKKTSGDDWRSLRSKSSTESFGPPTPPESAASDNRDRRFVWRPEPGIDIPASYDEPKPKPVAKDRERPGETRDSRPKREPPSLDTARAGRDTIAQPSPLTSGRASSPYAYSANSGKSTFSGGYLMSPDTLSPEARYHRIPGDVNRRPNAINTNLDSYEGRARASSGSAARMELPSFGRHKTAVPYPGEKSPSIKFAPSPSRRVELSSDESDLSHEETIKKCDHERSSRYSFVRTEHPRQASAMRYDEALQQSQKMPVYAPRPITPPLRPLPATWDALPLSDTKIYGSSMPTTAPLPMKSAIKQRGYSPRPSPLASPYTTPPPSPYPDSKRYSLEPPVGGRRSRPDSRPASPLHSAPLGGLQLPDEKRFRDNRPPLPPRSLDLTIPIITPQPQQLQTAVEHLPKPLNSRFVLGKGPRHSFLVNLLVLKRSEFRPLEGPIQQLIPVIYQSREEFGQPVLRLPPRPYFLPSPILLQKEQSLQGTQSLSHRVQGLTWLKGIRIGRQSAHARIWIFARAVEGPSRTPAGKGCFSRIRPDPPGFRHDAILMILGDPQAGVVRKVISTIAKEEPCPGKTGAVRKWFRLYDPESNRLVSTFDICPHCVRHLEAIFPNLKGQFIPAQMSNPLQKRTCDLTHESRRFATYVDTLEEISKQASEYRRPPNMLRFVRLSQKMANSRECTRDDMVLGQPWHFMPNLTEFTVCEECYDAVIWPEIAAGSEIAGSFNRTLQLLPPSAMGISCQLYSQRMRDMFLGCCRRNDWTGLRQSVLQRVKVERDLQGRLAKVRMYPGLDGAEEVGRLVEEWRRWE